MPSDSGFADPDEDPDDGLRPAWADTPDETDADRRPPRRPTGTLSGAAPAWLTCSEIAVVLAPLCARPARRAGGRRG
jgi:hypothetical protein